jgi:hypothetical protein
MASLWLRNGFVFGAVSLYIKRLVASFWNPGDVAVVSRAREHDSEGLLQTQAVLGSFPQSRCGAGGRGRWAGRSMKIYRTKPNSEIRTQVSPKGERSTRKRATKAGFQISGAESTKNKIRLPVTRVGGEGDFCGGGDKCCAYRWLAVADVMLRRICCGSSICRIGKDNRRVAVCLYESHRRGQSQKPGKKHPLAPGGTDHRLPHERQINSSS